MSIKNIRFAAATLAVIGFLGASLRTGARENVVTAHHKGTLRTTAAASGCVPAQSAQDLDINNVVARIMTGGDMWWNIPLQVAAYEIPAGSGKSSQFAASCWIGGFDQQGQLKVAGQTYRQNGNDYWPGALDANAKITTDTCALWDRFWQVNNSTILAFIALWKSSGYASVVDPAYDVIKQWPSVGNPNVVGSDGKTDLRLNPNFTYAPFVDVDGNGVYDPSGGDYPAISGDQFMWWVFNDAGNVKEMSQTAAIGVEVQTSAFAYATQDFLNNSTFYNYRVINRGALTIDSTYMTLWDDCDLGWYDDDYIGCDTTRGLGIQYNGTNDDGGGGGNPVNSYGLNPPQVGVDFFAGPIKTVIRPGLPDSSYRLKMTNFTYFNNDGSNIGNPDNGVQMYYYMTGSIRTGQRFSDDFQGKGIPSVGYGSGPISNFVFWGDPSDNSQWSECACNNNPGDRRFLFSAGPFTLVPGAINNITIGCVWAPQPVGGCGATNFTEIKSIDDQAQALFENDFKTIEGPQAPRMQVIPLDRKLIFYLVNDYGSNNYNESYGRNDISNGANYADSLQYHQLALKATGINNDTLYKFEGYRVFQLANYTVSSADIFDQTTGEVDNTKATEVFECDVRNGVTQIVNYTKNLNISDTTFVPQIKVNGKDSGIVHSFELTNDQFSTRSDKVFVNYQTYYFVAIAYAYNNFSPFNSTNYETTQDQPYLGSAHGEGGIDIQVIPAMPNPANGAMGTIINSDWGSGVVVTRVEGEGNGGNFVEINPALDSQAIANNSITTPTYVSGNSPVNVKVVNPQNVPDFDWVLQIIGSSTVADVGGNDTLKSLSTAAGWRLTAFKNGVVQDTIYSEESIANVNEQIIENYGISISIGQVVPPGIDQAGGNAYISSDITFADSSKPWLFGVKSQPDSNFANWLRTGNIQSFSVVSATNPCQFNDYNKLDTNSDYASLLSNFSPTTGTWGPYALCAAYASNEHFGTGTQCGFEVAYSPQTQTINYFELLPDVDIVFTSNKSMWTRCAVVEEQEDPSLAQGGANKFFLRNHAGWEQEVEPDGNTPIYSESDTDMGMSWFPGYAIDEGTGQRLNIVFGEDSYLSSDNGADMIWNPSSNIFSVYDNSILFGGKHIIYVLGSSYDRDRAFVADVKAATIANTTLIRAAYAQAQWVGVPVLNPLISLASLADGIIPTTTRLRFRVNRPYVPYAAADTTVSANFPVAPVKGSATDPYYTFSTSNLAPITLSDTTNRSRLLSEIYAVPNPYYGYDGYETSRLDTRVRIINLPAQVTIYIYSLDGSLIRTLSKSDPTTSYIDWDIKNSAGLPVASGMYLMDVHANGIGEVILKWFGAMRPIDVSTY